MPNRSSDIFAWTLLILTTLTSAWPTLRRRDVFDNAVDSPDGLIAHLQHFGESLYRSPDNNSGLKVAQWHEDMDVNPEELGNYVEGDILFPSLFGRNGLKLETARWPDGVIPFMISPYFSEYRCKYKIYILNEHSTRHTNKSQRHKFSLPLCFINLRHATTEIYFIY